MHMATKKAHSENAYGGFIHNNAKLQITQMLISEQMDKYTKVCSYGQEIFS